MFGPLEGRWRRGGGGCDRDPRISRGGRMPASFRGAQDLHFLTGDSREKKSTWPVLLHACTTTRKKKKRRKTQIARGVSCGHVLSLSFVRLYRGPYGTRLRRRRSCRRRRFGGTWGWGAQVRAWCTDVAVVEDVMLRRSVLASDCDAKRRRDAVR